MHLQRLWKVLPGDLTLIHAFVGGSSLHGATKGSSDTDYYGVFIEPQHKALGLDKFEHFCTSTSGNEARNTQDDVDVATWRLRMWAGLACKGNPTALNFLFAPNLLPMELEYDMTPYPSDRAVFWEPYVDRFRGLALSKKASKAFYGFASDQMKRLLGEKGAGKHGQRPELINNFGYDTKAAMHALRLIGEGIELMEHGRVTFPRPDKDFLIEVREGKYSLEKVSDLANRGLLLLDQAATVSKLPDTPDRDRMSKLVAEIYLKCYREIEQ